MTLLSLIHLHLLGLLSIGKKKNRSPVLKLDLALFLLLILQLNWVELILLLASLLHLHVSLVLIN